MKEPSVGGKKLNYTTELKSCGRTIVDDAGCNPF